jgi:hypothetical protein
VKFSISGYIKLKKGEEDAQTEKDHVQPDTMHALLMINNATSTEYGGMGKSPWTRLNAYTPNTIYDFNAPPEMLSEEEERKVTAFILSAAEELFALGE